MKILLTCSDGKRRPFGVRAAYSNIRSEKALRRLVASVLANYRKQGPAWNAYADALERKSLIEQALLIGILSN